MFFKTRHTFLLPYDTYINEGLKINVTLEILHCYNNSNIVNYFIYILASFIAAPINVQTFQIPFPK